MFRAPTPPPPNGPPNPQRPVPPSNPTPIVHQEYLNGDTNGWLLQWRIRKSWNVNIPRIKECKKRKESFSENFGTTLYKCPYKYHVHLSSTEMKGDTHVVVQIALNFENGENIGSQSVISNGNREVKVQKFEKGPFLPQNMESTIGPFQFNVCSFRQDGRKFRLVLHIFEAQTAQSQPVLVCSVISPPFIIRAKKPIKNPGTRGAKKRKRIEREKSAQSGGVPVPPPDKDQPSVKPKRKRAKRAQPVNPANKPSSLTQHLKQQQQLMVDPITFAPPQPPPEFQPMPLVMANPLEAVQRPTPPPPVQRPMAPATLTLPYQGNPQQLETTFDFLLPAEQEEPPQDKLKNLLNKVVAEFSSMGSERRIEFLSRLLEISYPTELEYLHSMFFSDKRDFKGGVKEKQPQIFAEMDKLVDENTELQL